jgi:hypothetical protein
MDTSPSQYLVSSSFLHDKSFCFVSGVSRGSSKARLAKSGFFDGLCLICHRLEIIKHIFWECWFFKQCCRILEDRYSRVKVTSRKDSLVVCIVWGLSLLGSPYVCRDLELFEDLCIINSLKNYVQGCFFPRG